MEDPIVQTLTLAQHVRPHQPVREVLHSCAQKHDGCIASVTRALRRLNIDPATAIGRLKRSTLLQLSHCLARDWSGNRDAAGKPLGA